MRIYCDIDGVLADCSHRLKYINHKKKDYDKFYSYDEIMRDNPMYNILSLAPLTTSKIIFISGRRISCLKTTKEWFEKHFRLYDFQNCQYLMRDDNDLRPSSIIKAEKIKLQESYEIDHESVFFIDDDIDNINAVKKACPHITCILWKELNNQING